MVHGYTAHCQLALEGKAKADGWTDKQLKAQALRWHQGDREEKETRNIPPIKSEVTAPAHTTIRRDEMK